MALKKPTNAALAATADAATPAPAATVAASPEISTAVVAPAPAPASTTALSVANAAAAAKGFQKEVEDMRGASNFAFGNYVVFKGTQGEIKSKETKVSLGKWAEVRLISWDEHFEISPGESGGSSKDYVAYSKDGKVIDNVIGEELRAWVGRTIEDYKKFLVETEGFEKTKSRRFIDTACALLATESGEGPVGKVIQIVLPPSSIPAFSRYQQDLMDNARCVTMGLPGFSLPEDAFQFFFIREEARDGDNEWTKLRISQNLPTKI